MVGNRILPTLVVMFKAIREPSMLLTRQQSVPGFKSI